MYILGRREIIVYCLVSIDYDIVYHTFGAYTYFFGRAGDCSEEVIDAGTFERTQSFPY